MLDDKGRRTPPVARPRYRADASGGRGCDRRLMLPLFITAAALQAVSGPLVSAADRYHRCLEAATQRPAEGETEAIRWKAAGGGVQDRKSKRLTPVTNAHIV